MSFIGVDFGAAHDAVLAFGITGGAAFGAGEGGHADFAISLAVAGFDFGDFGLEDVVINVGVVAEEFPHGLAHEGEAINTVGELGGVF